MSYDGQDVLDELRISVSSKTYPVPGVTLPLPISSLPPQPSTCAHGSIVFEYSYSCSALSSSTRRSGYGKLTDGDDGVFASKEGCVRVVEEHGELRGGGAGPGEGIGGLGDPCELAVRA